jgi:hypothetical protein
MGDDGAAPEQAELVYVPEPSWAPLGVALGLGLAGIGVFFHWVALAVGVVFLAASLRSWWRDAGDQFVRLPRRQRLTAAVLPAVPMRRPRG